MNWRKIALLLVIGIGLIFFSYYYVDKPMAEITFNNNWRRFIFLKWLTYISAALIIISALSIIYTTIKKFNNKHVSLVEQSLFVGSLNTLITSLIAEELKFIFGRTWPATWINNNPSWLSNQAYGFHLLHGGKAYASFPSGHATVVFAMISVLWFGQPKWRWLHVLLGVGIAVGLVGMYYHFVSDVIGGALLGTTTGCIAARAFLPRKNFY